MNIWNQLTDRFNPRADKRGFTPHSTPTADEWLVVFTESFVRHPDTVHATNRLMSGLPYFTAEFVARVAALPSPETRRPSIGGRIPRAMYATTGPIIGDVYQKLISRSAGRGQIQVAFAQAVPVLVDEYDRSML